MHSCLNRVSVSQVYSLGPGSQVPGMTGRAVVTLAESEDSDAQHSVSESSLVNFEHNF